ncbi:MAG: aminoglycoside phosphotransferase family protein [Propioniciclava sp.]|uniref:aminoglycoside phosphotransferase family protein n=1 Tax=Propioniciclava sp. TaxID=2038686 RepID=UPI0039E28FA5
MEAWLEGLPRLIADTFRRWHVTLDGDPMTGYTALVLPVRDADGVRRACKFSFVEGDNAGEIATLQRWRGRGAVELLRADPRRGVLLLEWLGASLHGRWDAEEAARSIAALYPLLHRRAAPQLPDGHAFVRAWLDDLAALGRRAPAPPQFVDWALRAGRALAAEPGTHVVHGDLHYLNVLERDGEPVAIDPKGFNADPCYEPAPLLWNRWDDLVASGDVGGAIRDRFYAIVDTAGLDERRARDWVVVRCMINVAWQAAPDAVAGGGLRDPREWLTRNVTIAKAMQGIETS